jgi:formamidopyrimidine-DNA glycosylase
LKPKRKIKNIKLYYPGIIKEMEPKKFINTLIGQSFQEIDRYGKYLILKLNKYSIISHLRM